MNPNHVCSSSNVSINTAVIWQENLPPRLGEWLMFDHFFPKGDSSKEGARGGWYGSKQGGGRVAVPSISLCMDQATDILRVESRCFSTRSQLGTNS